MEIQTNFSLKNYNTFGIEASAKQFIAVHNVAELRAVLEQNKSQNKFILGGGSNMLLTKDIEALVIHIDLKGRKIIKENEDFVWRKLARICDLDHRPKLRRTRKYVAHSGKCGYNSSAKHWRLWN
jgi:UDP-N-acetylenolpyruvoylglucosamine reductase